MYCICSFLLLSTGFFLFKTLTMADMDAPKPQLPPFTPPKFHWNQDNLYEQFKSFKCVVEFAFKGQYETCPNNVKCGSILNWLGKSHMPAPKLTKDSIINHPKYAHLFRGIGSFHCPVYNNWHDKYRLNIDLTSSLDSIHLSLQTDLNSNTHTTHDSDKSHMPAPKLTKDSIINHPKYAHLFRDIGRFKCNPVHITTRQDGVPVQKPPRRVSIAMH